MQINFFVVKTNAEKLNKIVEIANLHLKKKEPLTFLLPDAAALSYLDELLWKYPEDSFLPHPSRLITLDLYPTQDGHSLFNLRTIAYAEAPQFKTLYELEDHTTTEKLHLSKSRYQTYRKANFSIAFSS